MNYGNGYGYPQNCSQGQQTNFENTFAWVYGDANAEAYPVAPGKTVLLMHYNEPVLYVKSVDMNGRPMPMEVYDLVRRGSAQAPNGYYSQAPQLGVNMNDYVKNSELESKVNEIMSRNMQPQRNMNPQMQGQSQSPQQYQNQNWNQEVQ